MTLSSTFQSLRQVPTIFDGTATGTATLLVPVSTSGAPHGQNRALEIENTSTGTLSVVFRAKGGTFPATEAQGRRVIAGKSWSVQFTGEVEVGIIGSSTYNAILSDR
jgi:hypothetical protein